jgi:hypothetical protein
MECDWILRKLSLIGIPACRPNQGPRKRVPVVTSVYSETYYGSMFLLIGQKTGI